jgi:hypothetical protein
VPDEKASASQILDAKVNTEEWLRSLGVDDNTDLIDPAVERALAAQAFGALTGAQPTPSFTNTKEQVLALKTPEAVRKTVAMLNAYEWAFVEQAQNIRSYIVNGLVEETKNPKADIRLKAFKLLGEVTEVALFTQRTEIVTKNMSNEQIEEEIKKRLERLTINTPILERIDSEVDDAE